MAFGKDIFFYSSIIATKTLAYVKQSSKLIRGYFTYSICCIRIKIVSIKVIDNVTYGGIDNADGKIEQ